MVARRVQKTEPCRIVSTQQNVLLRKPALVREIAVRKDLEPREPVGSKRPVCEFGECRRDQARLGAADERSDALG